MQNSTKFTKCISSLSEVHRYLLLRFTVPDFPDLNRFRERVSQHDFTKFPKLNQKMIDEMDKVLGEEIPALLKVGPNYLIDFDPCPEISSGTITEKRKGKFLSQPF